MSCGKSCACPTYRDHLRSISFGASATPTRRHAQEPLAVDARESRWQRDGAAYRRLRKNKLQPKRIAGCAQLEATARDRVEIEDGRTYSHLKEVKEIKELLADPAGRIG